MLSVLKFKHYPQFLALKWAFICPTTDNPGQSISNPAAFLTLWVQRLFEKIALVNPLKTYAHGLLWSWPSARHGNVIST